MNIRANLVATLRIVRESIFLYGQSHFLFSLCPPPPIFTPFYFVRSSLSFFYFPLVSIWKMNFLSIRILFFFGNVFPRVSLSFPVRFVCYVKETLKHGHRLNFLIKLGNSLKQPAQESVLAKLQRCKSHLVRNRRV